MIIARNAMIYHNGGAVAAAAIARDGSCQLLDVWFQGVPPTPLEYCAGRASFLRASFPASHGNSAADLDAEVAKCL